jgi:hypothetical protein
MTSTDATNLIRTAKHSEPTSFASSTVAYNKQILPLTINGDTRLLVKCEALRDARDVNSTNSGVISQVLSSIRTYAGVDIYCAGTRSTPEPKVWLVLGGPVEAMRRLMSLKWYLGKKRIPRLTVALEGDSPYRNGQIIQINFAAPALDPASLYESLEQLRPYVIVVDDKDAYPVGTQFVYASDVSLPELKRQGEMMAKEVARVLKLALDVVAVKTEYEIVIGDVFQQSVNNLGPTLTPYVPVGISTPTPSPLDRQMAGMTTAIGRRTPSASDTTAGPSDPTAGQKRPRSEDETSVRAKAVMLAARKLDESVKKLDQAEEYRYVRAPTERSPSKSLIKFRLCANLTV